ncbi:hypothetical protein GCM10012285_64130 [Streptomyces kronopolitis]|uniref:Uncharacterized protein n=1 Tax=Streptomyces kronopolitis TaxID=1612435 RepID=A0ABQ2K1N1_9ACTN|nr:hypothetical protein GCM10012285_64130 [Streptomyces kronopolitis]
MQVRILPSAQQAKGPVEESTGPLVYVRDGVADGNVRARRTGVDQDPSRCRHCRPPPGGGAAALKEEPRPVAASWPGRSSVHTPQARPAWAMFTWLTRKAER